MSMSMSIFAPFLQSIIFLLCLWEEASAAPSPAKQGCAAHCGDVSVPYPFGIGKNCFFTDYFSVHCNHSSSPPKPFLNHTGLNLELLNVSLQYKTAMVNGPVTPLCRDNGTWRSAATDAAGAGIPFRFSAVHNIFMVVGCDANAVLIADEREEILAGCTSNCNGGSGGSGCYGIRCCQTTIPYDNRSTHIGVYRVNYTKASEEDDCAYAFLGARDWFSGNVSGPAIISDSGYAPAVMFWEMETASLGRCSHQKLDWQSETTIESCSCENRYEGNPYLPNGCQVVEACANCSLLECGMIGDEYQCFPSNGMAKDLKAMILGLGIGGGLLLLFVGSFGCYKRVKTRRDRIRKEKNFERNGGLLLQHQLSSSGTFEKTKIFTTEELEMATDNFNKSRVLGKGGQGTVYKGMLNDGSIVAVKRSTTIAESQLKQFINEIMILSQIKHRNIVKLLGCCFETEVPLLVYEFIPNGTLFELIHGKTNEYFSWDMRLRIASEAAEALAYLHSSSSSPIYHRDVKTTNILIDEKYRAKVSDFGTSRSISVEQTHLTTHVKGTFGYFDPEYFQSGRFTQKSDVYSFGVVLVELLTGKKPVYWTSTCKEEKSLVVEFISSLEENQLYDHFLDDRVRREGEKEKILAIANLTKRCLNLKGKRRPTMKEVVFELEQIRMTCLPPAANSQQDQVLDHDHDEYCIVKTMGRRMESDLSYRRSYSLIDL